MMGVLGLDCVVFELKLGDSPDRAVSYAIVVSSISRKMMRQSNNRRWIFEGGRAKRSTIEHTVRMYTQICAHPSQESPR